jgi:hypothetical protein
MDIYIYRNSSVGKATEYRLGERGSIPGKGTRGSECDNHLHLVPR